MLRRIFGILILTLVLGASIPSWAQNPCSSAQWDASAKRTLDRTENLLRVSRPDLYQLISSTGTGACNPLNIYLAGALPGEKVPHIQMQTTCGAVMTFQNASQAQAVAHYLREKNLGGAVCVYVNGFRPHPAVSSGN